MSAIEDDGHLNGPGGSGGRGVISCPVRVGKHGTREKLDRVLAQLSVPVTVADWDGKTCTLQIRDSCDQNFVLHAILWAGCEVIAWA